MNSRQDAEECVNDAYLGAWHAIPPVQMCIRDSSCYGLIVRESRKKVKDVDLEIGILDKSVICVIQPVIKALFGNADMTADSDAVEYTLLYQIICCGTTDTPVSYTHLDVYKRQPTARRRFSG